MSTLNTIIAEIDKVKPLAEQDVETNANPQTLTAKRGQKRQAVEKLTSLSKDYEILLRNNALFLIVTGSERDTFAGLAAEKFSCYVTNPENLYTDIVNKIPDSILNGRESASSLFGLVSRHLEDKAGDLFALEMPLMTFKQAYNRAIKSKDDLLQLTKQAINEQVGVELVGAQAVRDIVKSAIETKHVERITPVVLNTSDEKLAQELLSGLSRMTHRVYLVQAGETTANLAMSDEIVNLTNIDEKSMGKFMKNLKRVIKN